MNMSFYKRANLKRVVGNRSDANGPTVIFLGGVHGNEPAGLIALQNVFDELEQHQIRIEGRVLGLAGNLPALREKKRFIAKDLNRIWKSATLDRLRQNGTRSRLIEFESAIPEYAEQLALYDAISNFLVNDSPVYFIDLHTTSSRSVPFIAINDQLKNRDFAFHFPVPIVLGIEEHLEGTLLNMVNDFDHVAMAFEAGQHDDPESSSIHTSFIYLSMCAAAIIRESDIPNFDVHKQRIVNCGREHQGAYEVIYRKPIAKEDKFKMRPGYLNFANVAKNEIVAQDRTGPINAGRRGKIFMPLYQAAGEDGFFIVRGVPKWTLALSKILRRINFESALICLPGIRRDPHQLDALIVDKSVARFLATELFHLLGYRRKQIHGNQLIFARREIRNEKNSTAPSNKTDSPPDVF